MGKGHPGIAKLLVEARRALGVSQRELSKRSELTQAQISRIENGLVDMRLSSLLALAGELRLELRFEHQPPSEAPAKAPKSPKARRPESGDRSIKRLPGPAPRTGIFGDIDEELL